MTALVINVGNVPYAEDSLAVLRDFFEWNEIPLVVVDQDLPQNYHRAHPSWLKMFCHELIDDDFILCWDLDLLPDHRYNVREAFSVRNDTKFHIGIEMGLLYGFGMDRFGPSFKYNCGLMGVPKSFGPVFRYIYDHYGHNPLGREAWEQLYVNDYLVHNQTDIQIFKPEYNCSISPRREFLPYVKNKHYTYGVMDVGIRTELIKQHRHDYFARLASESN